MTIHDFIAAYNKTFEYFDKKYGDAAVRSLWDRISREWCTHLDDCLKRRGLEGCMEYWGGGEGTLEREDADCNITLKDGVFSIVMHNCPSVAEVRSRGQEPYVGSITYCDHCEALYAPILAKHGFKMIFDIEYNEDGSCAGRCKSTVKEA
jgi:hypothetical protein